MPECVGWAHSPERRGQLDPYMHASLRDPILTTKGAADARGAQSAVAAIVSSIGKPELIVTSPMRRAAQTALIAFDSCIGGDGGVPIVAHELLRESFMQDHICDQRLPRSELKAAFPAIDYDQYVFDDKDDEACLVGERSGWMAGWMAGRHARMHVHTTCGGTHNMRAHPRPLASDLQ